MFTRQTWGYWYYVEWFENYCHGRNKKLAKYYVRTWVAERDMQNFTGEYVITLRGVLLTLQQPVALHHHVQP